jgi:hypothetical protein
MLHLFCFAFGPPKPAHEIVLGNWALCYQHTTFHIITDHLSAWKATCQDARNLNFIHDTVPNIFNRAFSILNVDPEQTMQNLFFNVMNGWTVCGLRPIFALLYPDIVSPDDMWGWIDWDVLVNPYMLDVHLKKYHDKNLLLMPTEDEAWEMLKVFRGFDMFPIYKGIVNSEKQEMEKAPLEAVTVYHLRGIRELKADGVLQNQIAVHWHYIAGKPLVNVMDVVYHKDGRLENGSGYPLFFFVADTEVKQWSEEDVKNMSGNDTVSFPVNKKKNPTCNVPQ